MTIQTLSQRTFLCIACLLFTFVLGGCAQYSQLASKSEAQSTAYQVTKNTLFSHIATSDTKQEKDRAAILAMQGEYKVDFDFQETVVLQAGYERRAPKHSDAFEVVLVVESSAKTIVLQHILVVGGGSVVKHWRQDWTYEAGERFEFAADQTWTTKPITADKRKGAWTQCVYEVSDAPRYCGTGTWNHRYGVSTWTSDRTWRPLPRREYTVRSDYNALNVENRHTVTPQGWTHEQDNTKVIRSGSKTQGILVREFGFNNYRRIDGHDFSSAYRYWSKTSDYWRVVRDAWSERFAQNKQVVLKTEVDGMPIITAMFSMAESIESASDKPEPTKNDVDKVLDQWVAASVE